MDGGYNCGNFVFDSLDYMDSMWFFATWISNSLGHFFTLLPFGGTLAGLNFYTSLIIGFIGVFAYFFAVDHMECPPVVALVLEITALSLCWLPSVVLYTYLTYGAILAGTVLLYKGLTRDRELWLIAAGMVFGLDVGIRFSNLVHAGFILALWIYGAFCHWKPIKVLKKTGICVAGYLMALGAFLVVMSVKYGFTEYMDGVLRLFAMTKDAQDYTAGSMAVAFFENYLNDEGTYWIKRFGLVFVAETVLFVILVWRREGQSRNWMRISKAVIAGVTVIFTAWIIKNRFCNRIFYDLNCLIYPYMFLMLFGVVLCGYIILSGTAKKEDRLLAVLVVLTVYISSLGGNNAIYASVANSYLVLPGIFVLAKRVFPGKFEVFLYPVKTILAAMAAVLLVQGIQFGHYFVYEESLGQWDVVHEINAIPVLQGIHTERHRISEMEALYAFLKTEGLEGKRCIVYGNIPGLVYYMGLTPAMNTWSDLDSYNYEVMKNDLEKLTQKMGEEEPPLVILNAGYAGYYCNGDEESIGIRDREKEKFCLLCGFMDEMGYVRRVSYQNENFAVFTADFAH